MSEYHHSQRTKFTPEEVAASVGKRATLALDGTIVGWQEGENGPFVRFQIDERFGFGVQVFGLDLELLTHVRDPAEQYVIVNADSWDDFNGPHEIFEENYGSVDKADREAMRDLADSLTRNFDGNYVVRTKREFDARKEGNA